MLTYLVFFNDNLNPLPLTARADRIVIEKDAHQLTLYAGGKVLRSYPVSLGRGGSDAKTQQGDKRTPEGKYRITGHVVNSTFHRALRISYPNADDLSRASQRGVNAGNDIMIHGIHNGLGWVGRLHRLMDWTTGCIALTDAEVEEVFRVVRDGTPVEIKK